MRWRTVDAIIAKLPREEQEAIARRSQELIAEYMALQELRKAMDLTQKDVARELGIAQDGVSRLEKRSDLLISTLRKYIEAMGGTLRIVAEFPDRPPVAITGFSEAGQAE